MNIETVITNAASAPASINVRSTLLAPDGRTLSFMDSGLKLAPGQREGVLCDRNHPSVILYSVGNEIHINPKPDIAKPILRGLVDIGHELDPTRPVPQSRGLERQSWWSEKPMVRVLRRIGTAAATPADPGYEAVEWQRRQVLFPDWTAAASGPQEENVEVYSNAAEVELFLNGKSLGRKAKRKDSSLLPKIRQRASHG